MCQCMGRMSYTLIAHIQNMCFLHVDEIHFFKNNFVTTPLLNIKKMCDEEFYERGYLFVCIFLYRDA